MIAEMGHFALILALMMAAVGAVWPHIAIRRGDAVAMDRTSYLAVAQFALVVLAFAALTNRFLASDFSVKLVAQHSHTLKPLIYKISGVWGNHEGSLLLWILILTLFTALVGAFGKGLPRAIKARVLSIQNLLVFGFLLFTLLTSNPFERLDPAPFEGNGLNPLLQDIGLALHPPLLYLGYVGVSVAFSFAVAALIDGAVTPQWARYVRPWTLLAWMFLTGGIALGSWWAYYELGWGGWWFWDPVENASFMPWLAATALLHSAIVVEKRDSLKSWTVLLAIIAFSFSLLGTFLVRSGVLTSVHAFANDPERGLYVLGFLALTIGGSLSLYAWRAPSLRGGGLFSMTSRESALVLNNVLLASFAGVVLVGTLYPLFLEAATGDQITVGPPFFNFATRLIMAPLVVALAFGPLLAWKRGKIGRAAQLLLPALITALVVALGSVWDLASGAVLTGLGLAMGIGLIAAVKIEFWHRIKLFSDPGKALKRAFSVPRAHWGMAFAHGGLGLVILAITISEAWSVETVAAVRPGDSVTVGGYAYQLKSIDPVAGPNYTAVRGHVVVTDAGALVANLYPETRAYGDPITATAEAAITPLWHGDLYAVVGEAIGDGRWSVRYYYKPAISGLWLGALLMVLGGFLSLSDRRLRLGAATRRTPKRAPAAPAPAPAE